MAKIGDYVRTPPRARGATYNSSRAKTKVLIRRTLALYDLYEYTVVRVYGRVRFGSSGLGRRACSDL